MVEEKVYCRPVGECRVLLTLNWEGNWGTWYSSQEARSAKGRGKQPTRLDDLERSLCQRGGAAGFRVEGGVYQPRPVTVRDGEVGENPRPGPLSYGN